MTAGATLMYLAGLFACWWAGYGIGVAMKFIKDLGSQA